MGSEIVLTYLMEHGSHNISGRRLKCYAKAKVNCHFNIPIFTIHTYYTNTRACARELAHTNTYTHVRSINGKIRHHRAPNAPLEYY